MSKKSIAQQNKEEFIGRVNSEFGGVEDWDNKKAEISSQTRADEVYIQKDILATRLSQEGYIYQVHIGRARFTAKLQPEDVGLDPANKEHKDFIKQYLALGRKLLLPVEILRKLDRIDQRIRRTVDVKYSIPTVVGSFVPFKNIEPMKDEVEQFKREYFDIRDEIIERYDEIKAKTQSSYRYFAVEVYQLLNKDPFYFPTEEEIKKFIHSAMSYFPRKEEVYNSFYVTLTVGVVETTEFLTSQAKRLELIAEREITYKKELTFIERQLTEDSRIQAEHERQRLLIEKERAKTELMQLQAKQKAIQEAVAIKRDEHLPKLEQVFVDLAGAVHGIIFDTVDKVGKALKLRGSLSGADTRNLKNLAEKAKTLMIKPDPEVDVWLKKINEIAETAPEHRDLDEVREVIQTVRTEAARVILSLGNVPRTIRGTNLDKIEAAIEDDVRVDFRQIRMFPIETEKEKETKSPLTRVPKTRVTSFPKGFITESKGLINVK